MVSGLEEQLQKLKAKYPGLYGEAITVEPDGSRTLMAKRLDISRNEISYFYFTSPVHCDEHQKRWLSGTPSSADARLLKATAQALEEQLRTSERYRLLGPDGSIIEDRTTGLQWLRCSQGQHWNGVTCDGDAAKLTWQGAMLEPLGFSSAGYTDWRVPTKDELRTLVYCSSGQPKTWKDSDDSCTGDYESPTIDQVAFPLTGLGVRMFWSSSEDVPGSLSFSFYDQAWGVSFFGGGVGRNYKRSAGYVRLVRGGQ
jgi:hypothetical protein